MNIVTQKVIDFILPPRCLCCGKILPEDIKICDDCLNKIDFIKAPYCQICGTPFADENVSKEAICGACMQKKHKPFRMLRSAFLYDEFSKRLILSLKFMDKTENADLLSSWTWHAGADIFAAGVDVIMPIPLHYLRLLRRKYNQSAMLAYAVSKLADIAVDCSSLKRCKNTKPQVNFLGRKRKENVKGAFVVKNIEAVKGKRIVLIDDVMTTGSTLTECAKALRRAGAKSVDALIVARVL